MKYKVRRSKSKAESRFDPLPVLAGILFAGLPLVFSPGGFDQFRTPKDVFLTLMVAALAVAYLLSRPLRLPGSLKPFETLLLAGFGYVVLHSLLMGRSGVSLPAAASVGVFVLLFFLLQSIAEERVQKRIWLTAGIVLSINGWMTVLQYLGKFPLMTRPAGDELSGRYTPAGLISDANSGGLLFALISLIALYGVFAETRWRIRLTWAAILASNIAGLAFTRTLTALFGLAVCLVLWLVFHHWWMFRFGKDVKKRLAVSWILVLVGLAAAGWAAQRAGVTERVSQVAGQMSRGDWTVATAGRQPVYLITWQMIKEKPLLGAGLDSFGQDFYAYRAGTEYGRSLDMINQPGAFREVHNEYLQIWEELGFGGLLLFLGILALPLGQGLARLFRKDADDPVSVYFHAVLMLGLVLMAVTSLTFFPLHLSVTAAFAVLLVANLQSRLPRRPDAALVLENKLPSVLRKPAVRAVVLIGLASLPAYGQIQAWRANREVRVAAFLLAQAEAMPEGQRIRRVQADEAIRRLERAEKLNPHFHEVYHLRGLAAAILGRHDEAKEWYFKAAAVLPSPEVYTRLAQVHIATGQSARARSYLQSALHYNPGHEQALQVLESLDRSSR